MTIQKRVVNEVVIFDLKGRIDKGGMLSQEIQEILESSSGRMVLLNLARVKYMDEYGLGEIVAAYTRLSKQGGRLKLLNPRVRVRRLFNVTKLNAVFESFEDEDEAVRSF